MRYHAAKSDGSDLWQRVLYVLLGVAGVVLCYFAGAYWIGPWLHRLKGEQPAVSSPLPTPTTTNTASSPSESAPFSPAPPRLVGVRIRETDPSVVSDTVRVIPSGEGTLPDEHTQTEQPQPPATLEEQPSAPPPPPNLWAPQQPSPRLPRPANEPSVPHVGIQVPESLNGEPAPAGNVSASGMLYRVRMPETFESREEADAALRSVTDKGLPAAIVTDTVGGRKVFRVQLGVYRNKSSAEKLAEQARQSGISAEVTVPSP